MSIKRWEHPNVKMQLFGILIGFAEILDGLVTVLSLGFLASNFQMTVAKARALSCIKERTKNANFYNKK